MLAFEGVVIDATGVFNGAIRIPRELTDVSSSLPVVKLVVGVLGMFVLENGLPLVGSSWRLTGDIWTQVLSHTTMACPEI